MRRVAIIIPAIVIVLVAAIVYHSSATPAPAEGTKPSQSLAPVTSTTLGSPETLGVDVWWHVKAPYETASAMRREAESIVKYAAGTLHANSMSIGFPIYTPTETSDRVVTTAATPTPADLRILISAARAAHLRLEFRPLLNVGFSGYGWRGDLKPDELPTFFTSYYEALRPYLQLAQSEHISTFVYASEFLSLSTCSSCISAWKSLLAEMATQYHGELEYDSSGAPYLDQSNIVPGPIHDLDAYFATPYGPTASVRQLFQSWSQTWSALPASQRADTTIEELGFISEANGYRTPWGVNAGRTDLAYLDMSARWFTMACQIVKSLHLRGVYFWNLDFNVDPLTANGRSTSLGPTYWIDRSGATAIAGCFQSFAATAPAK